MLTPEQNEIQQAARRFAREVLAPGAAQRERDGCIERGVFEEMGRLGLMGIMVDPAYGGSGIDYVSYALALMEIAAGDGAVSTAMSIHNAPFCAILEQYGSPMQKARVLRGAARGEFLGAFALTEQHAGSDASAIRTRAVRRRDGYVLEGEKHFITSGRSAAYAVVFAVTEPHAGKHGISAFLVPTSASGYRVTRVEQKLGQNASDTCSLSLDGIQLTAEDRIGEEGDGYRIALSSLEAGRIGIAAQAVGMGQAALDCAVAYARERKAFGKAIVTHQAVAFRLVEARARLEAARQLVLHAARLKDADQDCVDEACMAKLVAADVAEAACSAALQTLGGHGYVTGLPLERIWRDVRACQIVEGTSDIQKMILARRLAA